MKAVVGFQLPVVGMFVRLSCILLSAFCLLACIPSLEEPDCDQARDAVREFYSYHFGNDQKFGPQDLEQRSGYITPGFRERLHDTTQVDPFTLTADTPKAFRAGECRVVEPARRVAFELLLFWKTDTRSEQRTIIVEAENVGGKWLVDRVTN
jgi:hypothetical protein